MTGFDWFMWALISAWMIMVEMRFYDLDKRIK